MQTRPHGAPDRSCRTYHSSAEALLLRHRAHRPPPAPVRRKKRLSNPDRSCTSLEKRQVRRDRHPRGSVVAMRHDVRPSSTPEGHRGVPSCALSCLATRIKPPDRLVSLTKRYRGHRRRSPESLTTDGSWSSNGYPSTRSEALLHVESGRHPALQSHHALGSTRMPKRNEGPGSLTGVRTQHPCVQPTEWNGCAPLGCPGLVSAHVACLPGFTCSSLRTLYPARCSVHGKCTETGR